MDAYDEGYEAFGGYESNPHDYDSREYDEWDRGYRAAEDDFDNERGPWSDFDEDEDSL